MLFLNLKRTFLSNIYLLIGIAVGFLLCSNFDDFKCTRVEHTTKGQENVTYPVSIKANITRKPSLNRPTSKVVRPRYYSTELGMREKLFVGVFTSEERLNTQAVHINQTAAHLVDKIKFFITTQHKLKSKFNLTGIVGFTDTRQKYQPLQIIKYLGDTFVNDYDYYFLMKDYNYLNVRKLKEAASQISVSVGVYLGTPVQDSSYCDLDSGILISNSVLKAMREHLDWCVVNAISDDHSENFGRCVHYSTKLTCQEKVQGHSILSYKIKHFSVDKHLKNLTKNAKFNNAVTIYPILEPNDFYILHAYFSKRKLAILKQEIRRLSQNLTEGWPAGQRTGSKPATRFDLPAQDYFNMSHVFFPDDFTNIRKHSAAELQDISLVLEEIKAKVLYDHGNNLQFRRLVNGYRTFDLSRGMDYLIDVGFRDANTGKEVVKRFEVCKPLGKVEFIPVPYVTENNRVTILLPIQEHEVDMALDFINNFARNIMERREKTFLMLVQLYQSETPSKGVEDKFLAVKNLALKLSIRFKSEDSKIAWVSIRLPAAEKPVTVEENQALNFAIVDLALKKIGLDSIVLVLDVFTELSADFLNRVRMNTIMNFQIFSAIPFRQYNQNVSYAEKLEVSKAAGHFDREEFRYISFYGKDYVSARKKFQATVPIIRGDNDVPLIMKEKFRSLGNVFSMFLEHADNIHCMRATDNLLIARHHSCDVTSRKNFFLGTKAQLAKLILSKNNNF